MVSDADALAIPANAVAPTRRLRVDGAAAQSVFDRLAGYKDVNDAERLAPAMCACFERSGAAPFRHAVTRSRHRYRYHQSATFRGALGFSEPARKKSDATCWIRR